MTNPTDNVVPISSRPEYRDRSGDYQRTRRLPSARAVLGSATVAAVLFGGGAMVKLDGNAKHDERVAAIDKAESDNGQAKGEKGVFVLYPGANLRRTPQIPGRATSGNPGDTPDASKDSNIDQTIKSGHALVVRGTITEVDSAGYTWHGVEIVKDYNNVEPQNRGDLADEMVWFSDELFGQEENGQALVEQYGSGKATVHFQEGHYVDEAGKYFAVGQMMDIDAAKQLHDTSGGL